MADKVTVLVTGTGGFIGGRLVELLYLRKLAHVRAGLRSWSSAARIARFPVEIVLCDIMDPDQVRRAMTGATAVVHCAYTDQREVILQGTRNLLKAALVLGVERFVYLSTAEIYGHQAQGVIDETAPYQATGREYTDAKIAAEQLCWDFYAQGVPVTILRPSIVYGPFSRSWTIGFANRLQSGNWGLFDGYGDGTCNLVYVDDLAAAINLALRCEGAVGEAFNVNGPDQITWNDYFERFNQALGLPPLRPISSGQSTVKARVMDLVGATTSYFMDRFGDRLMDIYLHNPLARSVMKRVRDTLHTTPAATELQNLYSRQAIYSMAKAQRLLEYRPQFDVEAGLRLSVLWLHHHGFLRQPPSSARQRIEAV